LAAPGKHRLPGRKRFDDAGKAREQPLACVIVGGMLLSPICSLLVIPVFARFVMPKVSETDAGRTWATEH
jgi:hypothetical protein